MRSLFKLRTYRWVRYRNSDELGEPHYALRTISISFPEIVWTPDFKLILWVKQAYGLATPKDKFYAEEFEGNLNQKDAEYDPIPF